MCEQYDNLEMEFHKLYKILQEAKLIQHAVKNDVLAKLRDIRYNINILKYDSYEYKTDTKVEIAPDIIMNVVKVDDRRYIPDTPLYYVANEGAFGVKIAGKYILGNICEIGKDIPAGAFIHTTRATTKNNKHMRHIGNRSSLNVDKQTATKDEIEMRGLTTAHDLLIWLTL